MLRCTAKARALLGDTRPNLTVPPAEDDWYLNLLWVDGRKCLLLTHAGTLFSVFAADVRTAAVRPIGPYVVSLIEAELRAEALPIDCLGSLNADDVQVGKTANRSVLGFMNDIALLARSEVDAAGGLARCDIPALNHWLHRTMHNGDRYTTAMDAVAQRLADTDAETGSLEV